MMHMGRRNNGPLQQDNKWTTASPIISSYHRGGEWSSLAHIEPLEQGLSISDLMEKNTSIK